MRQTWLDMRLNAGPAWTDSATQVTGLIPNNFSLPKPKLAVRLLRQDNAGPGAARNTRSTVVLYIELRMSYSFSGQDRRFSHTLAATTAKIALL